ncbi:Hypothetical predicted protein [Mytilus galloprovincialis]|uniref:Ig-like domain-containing protein n=1 Tax=Mytilus galloprovincialis TaxID=29158 RepID=A0A8B6CLT2_MYTGA|nr:Hypothetical predicted protein [Mytilus galloprovincialis]
MFADISLSNLWLNGNPITVIEKHAFVNLLFLIRVYGLFPFLEEIETEAFVNLSAAALTLDLSRNNATVIQKNAFKNVQIAALAMSGNSTIKENRLITFAVSGGIYFISSSIQCNCDLMWLVHLRHDMPVQTDGQCANFNKTVPELVPEDLHCIDQVSTVHICNVSQSVDLPCEYDYLTTNLIRWIHTRNGQFIRELNKDFIDEDTNTLHFSFCNYDDSGEYTCMLSTDYSLLPSINRSCHLNVNRKYDIDDVLLYVNFVPYNW